MHPDLSPHLHSEKCNDLIKLLQQCHKDHPLRKFVGFCNNEDKLMIRCLKEERLLRRQINLEKSRETREKIKQLVREEREKENQQNVLE